MCDGADHVGGRPTLTPAIRRVRAGRRSGFPAVLAPYHLLDDVTDLPDGARLVHTAIRLTPDVGRGR